MRMKYVLSEVLTGLWRNVTMTIAMVITMTVSLTMLGAGMLAYQWVDDMQQFYYAKVEVSIFLKTEITDAERQSIQSALEDDGLVSHYTYESKEQAYNRFKQMYQTAPDLVAATKPDALPASFRLRLKDPKQFKQISTKYKQRPGVDEIVDQQELLKKIFDILGSLQLIALAAAVIQGIAALLLVANTIQVAAYSKRREVAVMKLVGASNWFIQMPFVLEAVFAGFIGALLAFGMLCLIQLFLEHSSLNVLISVFPALKWEYVLYQLPILCGIAAAVSAVTGWITLRFQVKV